MNAGKKTLLRLCGYSKTNNFVIFHRLAQVDFAIKTRNNLDNSKSCTMEITVVKVDIFPYMFLLLNDLVQIANFRHILLNLFKRLTKMKRLINSQFFS